MPWRLRRTLYLVAFGVVMFGASVAVLVLNQNASSEILAAVGVLGGLAVILNAIVTPNGDGSKPDP